MGPQDPGALPLTVPVGAPLHIVLTKKVPVKHAGVPVEGKVAENVYVFDHLVIPAGSRVMGQVTKVDSAPRKQRALAIANGNFTPLRHAHVDFNTLVEADGKRIPLQTNVLQGAPSDGAYGCRRKRKEEKRTRGEQSRIGSSAGLESGRGSDQQCDCAGQGAAAEGGAVSKIALPSPVFAGGHKLHRRTQNALDLRYGNSLAQQLEKMGGPIPPGSLVHVRLVSPLSSATDHRDTPVRAVVSQPLFSSDHTLILPEGARLNGTITEAVPARLFARNGQLRFTFRQLELTPGVRLARLRPACKESRLIQRVTCSSMPKAAPMR